MRRNLIHALGLAVVAAVLVPAGADAQTPRGDRAPGPRFGAPVERLIEQREALGLTDQQVTQLRRIEAELQQKNAPLLAQLEQAREQLRAERPQFTEEQRQQMRARREEMRDTLRQRQQMTAEERQQMRERMQQMTPEQREQMRARMQARRDSLGRSGMPDRPGAGMPEELRATMEQLRTNNHAAMQQVQGVLTPEQQQKMRELRPERRDGARVPGARRGPDGGRERGALRAPRGAR
ncbi:MAG TPA: hypothetical protein VFZ24_08025 [Longimicrobiales bacterium]